MPKREQVLKYFYAVTASGLKSKTSVVLTHYMHKVLETILVLHDKNPQSFQCLLKGERDQEEYSSRHYCLKFGSFF